MSIQWLRRRKKHRPSGRARVRRAMERKYGRADLREGETLLATYCHDFAWCDCAPTGNVSGVPCLAVALAPFRFVARCLVCSERWIVPHRRRADRMLTAYGVR